MYKNFEDLINKKFNKESEIKKIILAGADDEHSLQAVFTAQEKGYVDPVLVGDENKVGKLITNLGFENRDYELYHCTKNENPSQIAVTLIHEKKGDFIMKGKMETRDLLKPILNKSTGLNSRGFITHFGLMEITNYHKLLAMSDGAVIPYPNIEEKKKIAKIGIDSLKKLGYLKPVVGVLCAVEKVNEKMPETLHAEELSKLSDKGYFGDGLVVGPISFDLATRKEAAEIKGYKSDYAGNVDMLLVPNMVTGNVMSKIWNSDSKNTLAGCLVGTDVPIVLTSRSASMKEKLHSIILCTILS
jgi:phosphotransacetylase